MTRTAAVPLAILLLASCTGGVDRAAPSPSPSASLSPSPTPTPSPAPTPTAIDADLDGDGRRDPTSLRYDAARGWYLHAVVAGRALDVDVPTVRRQRAEVYGATDMDGDGREEVLVWVDFAASTQAARIVHLAPGGAGLVRVRGDEHPDLLVRLAGSLGSGFGFECRPGRFVVKTARARGSGTFESYETYDVTHRWTASGDLETVEKRSGFLQASDRRLGAYYRAACGDLKPSL